MHDDAMFTRYLQSSSAGDWNSRRRGEEPNPYDPRPAGYRAPQEAPARPQQ